MQDDNDLAKVSSRSSVGFNHLESNPLGHGSMETCLQATDGTSLLSVQLFLVRKQGLGPELILLQLFLGLIKGL